MGIIIISLSACNKDYECECIVDNPVTGEKETTLVKLEGYSLAGAEDACNNRERYTVDSVQISCNLK